MMAPPLPLTYHPSHQLVVGQYLQWNHRTLLVMFAVRWSGREGEEEGVEVKYCCKCVHATHIHHTTHMLKMWEEGGEG